MSKIVAGAVIVLLVGIAVGCYAGVVYSQHQSALKLLQDTYQDAERQIRFYEKLRDLQEAGEFQRVADALDSQLEMARLSSRAAEMAIKGSQTAE